MAKVKRNLSGIFFRSFNTETEKWENICFEDLTEDEQNKIFEDYTRHQVEKLAKLLANTINEIGDKLDIMKD